LEAITMLNKIKNYLSDFIDYDMSNLDEDDLCELAIHYLMPSDLTDFFEIVNE
jgi:hypothetical protein